MNQLLRGEPLTVFGDGTQERAFTHVDDVAPVIARSVDYDEARNQVFNVGADQAYTVNELAQVIADAMGCPCNLVHLEPRNEVKIAFADHSKAEKVFAISEKKSLRDGVRAMATWVRKHGARESGSFEGIEVSRRLPPSWAKVTK
jgi:UDP-glucose 4-epimerase